MVGLKPLIFWQWTMLYTVEAFTSVMNAYHVNHITKITPLSAILIDWLKSMSKLSRDYFTKPRKREKIFLNAWWSTTIHPLVAACSHQCKILQSRSARSNLPISNAARQQLGLQSERLRNVNKNEHVPSHDLHIGQDVMYQDATNKQWYPATITIQCAQPRIYNITTREGVTYRKTQTHLKPYQLQSKKIKRWTF